jgi:hypothetical protein
MCGLVSSGTRRCDLSYPFTAQEFEGEASVARPFLPRIDFEFAAVFPAGSASPSPVAQDPGEVIVQALGELSKAARRFDLDG